ncbi:MAG: 30S ribosomal protein S20 [Candidatus Magasanikbacteria bacterium]|nr:30S ribosomal protein S20 [Candidatus Magasanikbacteria bacterium]
MPNKNNARKALRQAVKRTAWNKAKKVAFREGIKKVLKAPTMEEAKTLIIAAQKALDKAAKTGAIKKKTASRKLSRLMKKINNKDRVVGLEKPVKKAKKKIVKKSKKGKK